MKTHRLLHSAALLRGILIAALTTVALESAEHKILDLDLTKGPPPADNRLRIEGGEWDGGWRVVGDFDRILFDAGYDIRNGHFEVTVTRRGDLAFEPRKRNWMGFSASQFFTQAPGAFARAGHPMYDFSKAEFCASSQSATIGEFKFGKVEDWVLDDKTAITVRAEVRNNVMTWSNSNGGRTSAGSAEQPISFVRYAVVGGILDRRLGWHSGSLVGLRVLRMTVVDYEKPRTPAHSVPAEPTASAIRK